MSDSDVLVLSDVLILAGTAAQIHTRHPGGDLPARLHRPAVP
ncbi:hypothetical protein [Nonomuraea composti]|nr:hypothetical protein [Nonomuraea sp. FMUSA5-5]